MSLALIIDDHPADSVALVSRGRETTYGELRDHVARARTALGDLGVGPGDRVGIVSANNWYFVVSALAVWAAGGAVVPLNPRSPAAELRRELEAVDATLVLAGPSGARAVADAGADDVRIVAPDGAGVDLVATFDDLLAAEPGPPVDVAPDDLACLLFTSGTAGAPKAAVLTHRNLLSNQDQLRSVRGDQLGPDDVVLAVLPFFHIFGLNVVLGYPLAQGARLVLVERFDPANAVESIERHGVTSLAGVPPMWQAIADLPGVEARQLSSLRRVSSGAAALPPRVFEAMRDRFGIAIGEGYGLTEASPAVTSSQGVTPRPGSIGRPLPGMAIRLVDEAGDDVLIGDPGEIWVKGPNVFVGYWEDPEATAAALDADGWLHTGDVAIVDDDGILRLVDRAKDLVIVSGFNVYPAEVEEVLRTHPAVAGVVVGGVPHPGTGEAVVAYVTAAEGAHVDEDDLIDHARAQLARYKCPSKVRFVDELPLSAESGKAARNRLGAMAAEAS